MNYTKSGIIANGAPMSRARFSGEAELGWENPTLLLLTDEGRALAERFFRSIGCDPSAMPEEVKARSLNDPHLTQFLAGVIFALNLH
mgnify:CR=1 FL=1